MREVRLQSTDLQFQDMDSTDRFHSNQTAFHIFVDVPLTLGCDLQAMPAAIVRFDLPQQHPTTLQTSCAENQVDRSRVERCAMRPLLHLYQQQPHQASHTWL